MTRQESRRQHAEIAASLASPQGGHAMERSTRTTAKRPSLKPDPCSSLNPINPKPAAPWCIPQGRPGICRRCRARPRVLCEHQRPLSAAGASPFLCTPASAGALARDRAQVCDSVESLRASRVLACGAARGLMPSVQPSGSLLSHAERACYHTPRVPAITRLEGLCAWPRHQGTPATPAQPYH